MITATQRTLTMLRAAGHVCAIVEKWNPHVHRRQDLFGFLDIVCLKAGLSGILGVQSTTGSGHAEHKTKILGTAHAKLWLETGNRVWLVSWTKKGERGKRKLWTPRIEEILLGMFDEVPA